jgi:arginine-tRNA-protein transferase
MCPYFGSLFTSFGLGISYYASTSSLAPEFYQALIDRGWRRSGTTLYKPDLRASCCPHYTIRLDSHAFHASKGQRQTLNRFSKFILGKDYEKEVARLHPKSREQAKKRNTDFDLLERVHEPEKELVKTPLQPEHEFTVTLEPDIFTQEKYNLFENYQRIVHHEPPRRITRQGFESFLCNSPLARSNPTINGQQRKIGCKSIPNQLPSTSKCGRVGAFQIKAGLRGPHDLTQCPGSARIMLIYL